jgi:hypothetical protein
MTTTTYASFASIVDAEKAIGALLDHGARVTDISLIANESHSQSSFFNKDLDNDLTDVETASDTGKKGITTTTGADAGVGAAKGAGIGLGVGIIAALAAIFVPGFGLVVGGGALAVAAGAAAATTGAGAIAGGSYGYLRDQGVPEEAASTYHSTYASGGAVLAVSATDKMTHAEIEGILAKYNASNVNYYNVVPETVVAPPRAELY